MRSFRNFLVLSSTVMLAACGGDTSPQTVGSVAPPSGGTPTPTHSFVNPTEVKTYDGLGAVQHYQYTTASAEGAQSGQLYAGDSNTVRDSGISITYNPRDAIFELTVSRPLAQVSVSAQRFQDPAHRTAFGGAAQPQPGVPNFDASRQIQYLQSGTATGSALSPGNPFYTQGYGAANSDYVVGADQFSSTVQTFFYQKPGTTTKYVTYAGYVRNSISAATEQNNSNLPAQLRESYSLDRAAFVFGERTGNSAVPTTGSGTYTGEMIATVVYNPLLDTDASAPSFLQWMQGTQSTTINFGSGAVTTTLDGTMLAPVRDAYTSGIGGLAAGTAFHAQGSATIDLINKGGFTGQFASACFATSCTAGNSLLIAGSSLDGAFFGPHGEEIGAGFRIVGGRPDERIDILGAFTGKKP